MTSPYPLAARHDRTDTVVALTPTVAIGGEQVPIIAGPCAVENAEQLLTVARAVRDAGAVALRGGAFKPRTSPYAFQGLGRDGVALLAAAKAETGLAIVTEAVDEASADLIAPVADCIQIGARNMQNYSLLRHVARVGKPILLKRGMGATIDEWLQSAEYLLAEGNAQVVLCERGIRSFEPTTRHAFDIGSIPATQQRTHLPVIADPSHATGSRALVPATALGALAAGADALLIEVHAAPDTAQSDAAQSLTIPQFAALMPQLRAVARAVGRTLAAPVAILLTVLVAARSPLQAQKAPAMDPATVLGRARAEYATVRSARAEFTQEIQNPLLGRALQSRGTLLQRKPGKLAVTFTEPAGDRIVSDGRWLWVYLPSTQPGQVMRMSAGSTGTGGVDLAATVLDAPREGYTLADAGARTVQGRTLRGVTMTARADAAAPFPRATVWVDLTDGTVREVAITDVQGVTRTVRMVRWEKNVVIADDAFVFRVPRGVKTVDVTEPPR